MLANILKVRDPEKTIHLDITEEHVVLTAGSVRVDWPSAKQLVATLDL